MVWRTELEGLASSHIISAKKLHEQTEFYSCWLPKAYKRSAWSSALLQVDTDNPLSPRILSDLLLVYLVNIANSISGLCPLKEP